MHVTSLTFLEETISHKTSSFSDSSNFSTPFPCCSLSLNNRCCVVDISVGTGHETIMCAMYLIGCHFLYSLHLLYIEIQFPFYDGEHCSYLWYKN